MNNDALEDTESSTAAVRNEVTHTETTYLAWLQKDMDVQNGPPRVNVAARTTTGPWQAWQTLTGELPRSADPALAPHYYVAGFNPQTIYCAVTNYNVNPNNMFSDSAIAVWHNSGTGWVYQRAAYAPASDNVFLDKPSIAVSNNAGTHGSVYVAYIRSPTYDSTQRSLQVVLLNEFTGGQFVTRTAPSLPLSTSPLNFHSPTIMVDTPTGYVYLAFFDYDPNQNKSFLWVYESTDQAASWSYSFSLPLDGIQLLGYGPSSGTSDVRDIRICAPGAGNCVIAKSFISARVNYFTPPDQGIYSTIGFVFHARPAGGGPAQIYFVRFNFQSWLFDAGPTVIHPSGLDAWQPAIDYDTTGKYTASYYQRTDASTLQYKSGFTYIGNNGATDHDISCPSCNLSDLAVYYQLLSGGSAWARAMGEYQDIWYSSYAGGWTASTVDISRGQGDMASYDVVP